MLVLGEQVLEVALSQGRQQMVDHVETLLADVLELHLFGPVEIFDFPEVHLHTRVVLSIVAEARS